MTLNDLESQLRDFQTQTCPTVEQTVQNNASVLYKRKKFFLGELRQIIYMSGYIILLIIYLRDISMLRLVLRAGLHQVISDPYGPYRYSNTVVPDKQKRATTRFLLMNVFGINLFCFIIHLFFGVYSKSLSKDNYLHGGLSVQFIGERLPSTRLELMSLDLLVFAIQLVHHNLVCVVDDSKVLATKTPSAEDVAPVLRPSASGGLGSFQMAHADEDGYNGNVHLLTIDLFHSIKEVIAYEERYQYDYSVFERNNTLGHQSAQV